ncbi:protein phosphatase 2C domain-containing protein [Paenibacillus solisilvae]|uniref:Protein phosphatase 2C domain-containing protein n=1 Tax=Paenibacillus solisilvae TaxID=2486751 RepID=A0ABW0W5M9_9BACL
MQITAVSIQGSSPLNEDALIRNDAAQLFGVIDGASSLIPYKRPSGETGGYLAAQITADYFNERSGSDIAEGAHGLLEAFEAVNAQLREQMIESGVSLERKEDLWSACGAVVRVKPRWIEFAQLGDCMIAVYYMDGTIRIVTQDQVAHVDDRSKAVWAQGIAEGITAGDQLRHYVLPQIISGRSLANSPGGYSVLNGDPHFADYAEYGRISRTNVRALLLFSDGLYVPKPAGISDKDGAVEVASLVQEKGVLPFIQWLTELEESDPDGLQFPRMKRSDDKSAIWIELKQEQEQEQEQED